MNPENMTRQPTPEQYLTKAVGEFARRLLVVSPDRRLLAASGVFPQKIDDLIGRPCYRVLENRNSPCRDCALDSVVRTEQSTNRLVSIDNSTGNESIFRHYFPIRAGDRLDSVGIIDLDPVRFADLAPEPGSANAFLKNLLMSSVDGIIASDMTGRILIFNEAASAITGYDVEEALTNLDIRSIYPGEGAREVMSRLRSDSFGGKGKLKSSRMDLLRKDGAAVPIELSAAIVYEQNRETATVGFFHDLRSKLRMERDLQNTQVQLMQAEKMGSLGKLAAGVAHQLNNPLGGIILFAQIIDEEYNLEPRARQDLRRIIHDAERCQNIVGELLDFARQTSLEVRPNDINQAISRTIFLLEKQPLFSKINIIKDFDENLPLVASDLQQLYHVFMNIILNAADSMDGQGQLRILTRLAASMDRVCVEISDTGPGIPGHVLPHLFEPFFTTKEQGKGTGLGLSVAYGVVENHGGRITACSAPGEGATFVIELPIRGPRPDGDEK